VGRQQVDVGCADNDAVASNTGFPISPDLLDESPTDGDTSLGLAMVSNSPSEVAPALDVDPELSSPRRSRFEPECGHDSVLGLAAHDVVADHADGCEERHDQLSVGSVPGSRICPSGAARF